MLPKVSSAWAFRRAPKTTGFQKAVSTSGLMGKCMSWTLGQGSHATVRWLPAQVLGAHDDRDYVVTRHSPWIVMGPQHLGSREVWKRRLGWRSTYLNVMFTQNVWGSRPPTMKGTEMDEMTTASCVCHHARMCFDTKIHLCLWVKAHQCVVTMCIWPMWCLWLKKKHRIPVVNLESGWMICLRTLNTVLSCSLNRWSILTNGR